ncbi:MAG: hypothetical protein ACLQVI_29145 [Polyangiaceae bacterium]
MLSPTSLSTPASSAAPLPAPAPHVRPVPRQFLERVSRPLLARLLSAYVPVLVDVHAFPLAALAASAQIDRTHVATLWHLLGTAPPDLVPLRDDLLAVADVATHAGHEILLAHDRARVLDHELGAEDCAATARLEHRALFDMARPQTAGQAQTKSYATFQSKSPRPLSRDEACRAAFKKRMVEALSARGRSTVFKLHEWQSGSELHMELVYGRLASARDLIGKTSAGDAPDLVVHDITAQVTDRSTERAYAIFHDDTLRLDVAGPDWMKELVRRTLGETHFGSVGHFQGDETITLAPLADMVAALSVDGVPGLKKAELQELWTNLGGASGAWAAVGARGDCNAGASSGYVARFLTDGASTEASFLLSVAGRTRPLKLKVAPPRRLEFDRRDPRVERVVRDWVVARGFMSVPEHMRGSDASTLGERAQAGEQELS